MKQSRLESLIETLFGTALGFVVSFIAWPIAGWMFSIEYGLSQQFGVVAFFTIISVARGYVVRRWFNGPLRAAAVWLAAFIARRV